MAHVGEVEITDFWVAVLAAYSGFFCCKCETGLSTKWTFTIPAHDWEIVLDEWRQPDCTVIIREWIRAQKDVDSFVAAAKGNIGGIFLSPNYTQGYVPKHMRG
jgi:hypothetical protein